MKRKFIIFTMSFLLIFSIAGCAKEEKFVGSKSTPGFHTDMQIYESIEEIENISDLIVIASYSTDPQIITHKDAMREDLITYSSQYALKIEKVFKGNTAEESVITFWQYGKPDSDEYETKIKKGQKYLLFLSQKDLEATNGEVIFDATGMEQGIVEIQENNKLYSYYDIGIMPTYNGADFVKLEKELSK